jgi:hypothetical protein
MGLSVDDRTLFENADWLVTEAGLEHKGNGYFLERAQLTAKRSDGLPLWPLHMAEKSWCDAESFSDAFAAALRSFGHAANTELAGSPAADPTLECVQGATEPRDGAVSIGDLVAVEIEAIRRKAAVSESFFAAPSLGPVARGTPPITGAMRPSHLHLLSRMSQSWRRGMARLAKLGRLEPRLSRG